MQGEYAYSAPEPTDCVLDISEIHAAAQSILTGPNVDLQIIDARSPERFDAEVDEPREGVRRGKIPGSLNIPFTLLANEDGTMKSNEELVQIFAACEADITKKETISTCGSGVTACVVDLALRILGAGSAARSTRVYDGSWSEYGSSAP